MQTLQHRDERNGKHFLITSSQLQKQPIQLNKKLCYYIFQARNAKTVIKLSQYRQQKISIDIKPPFKTLMNTSLFKNIEHLRGPFFSYKYRRRKKTSVSMSPDYVNYHYTVNLRILYVTSSETKSFLLIYPAYYENVTSLSQTSHQRR